MKTFLFSFDFRIVNHENCATFVVVGGRASGMSERERQTLARKSIKKDVFLTAFTLLIETSIYNIFAFEITAATFVLRF